MGWWTSKLTRQSTRWRWLWMGWWTSRLRMKSTRWMRRKSISLSDKLYFWRKILTFQPQPQPGRRLGDHRRPWRVHGGGQQHGHWGGGGGLGFLANRPHFWGWDCTCPLRYWSWRICSWNICSPLFWDSFSPYFGTFALPYFGHLLSDSCSPSFGTFALFHKIGAVPRTSLTSSQSTTWRRSANSSLTCGTASRAIFSFCSVRSSPATSRSTSSPSLYHGDNEAFRGWRSHQGNQDQWSRSAHSLCRQDCKSLSQSWQKECKKIWILDGQRFRTRRGKSLFSLLSAWGDGYSTLGLRTFLWLFSTVRFKCNLKLPAWEKAYLQ